MQIFFFFFSLEINNTALPSKGQVRYKDFTAMVIKPTVSIRRDWHTLSETFYPTTSSDLGSSSKDLFSS